MSLKNKIVWIVALVVVTFASLLLYAVNTLAIKTFTVNKRDNVQSILEGQSSKIQYALSLPLGQVQQLAKLQEVISYAKSSKDNLDDDKLLGIFKSLMIGTAYSNVYLMDTEGEVVVSVDPSFLKNNFVFRDYFVKAMAGESHMEIAFGVLTHKPGYYFSAPIFQDEKVVGVVVIKVEVAYIDDLFDDSLTSTIGHYFLTDENGVVVSTDKVIEPYQSMGIVSKEKMEMIKEKRKFEGFGLKPLQYQVAQDVIENYSQPVSIDYLDHEDGEEEDEYEKEIIQVQKIGAYPFYLVTESSMDSIFGNISDIVWPISALMIVVVITGLAVLSFIFKRIFAPLAKLEEYTKDVARGKFSEVVKLKTGDEIQSLSESLAIMVATLQEAKANLEQKVEIKTSELGTSMAELEAKNLQMSKNEVAMLNILEDSKELEKQLATEKESVEQKVVERTRQLSDEQAKLMASISALPRAFVILDKDSKILTHNGRLEDIFGKQEEEWSVNLIDDLLGEKLDLQSKLQVVFEKKENFDISDILYKTKYLRVFVAPVVNKDGELLGAVMTIKDESEAKALSRSRDEFFSIASHELRTPLTAIRGNTSMIMDYYKEALKDKELKEMIEDTHTASIRLIGIVNDFLDMSRLEQGRMEYKKEQVDLVEIVDKVIKDLTESATEKGIELKIEGESSLKMMIDPGKFEQIMFNLVGNSLKFTDKGSITVNIKKEDDLAKIEVKDTGSGIALENQSLLFHKFQQAGASTITRDGSKGTGLGLYISRLMAEGMGGKLELISSEIGKGSIFGISLPIINEK